MATKDKSLKAKPQSFATDISQSDNSSRYSNLNLNKNQKSSDFSSLQFSSKSYNNKDYGKTNIIAAVPLKKI